MLLFGHVGIGKKMLTPWLTKLPVRYLLLGTILPDLIDKPLYYGLSWSSGKTAGELGLISGTRTFGHSGILLITLCLLGWRSNVAKALALGVITHLFLDLVGDIGHLSESATVLALMYPFSGGFGVAPFHSLHEHLFSKIQPYTVFGEITGLALLAWDYRKRKRAIGS